MKQYRILKSFGGSQDGIASDYFEAGTVRDISDHLASAVKGTGWIEPVSFTPVVETKVIAPEETKVEAPEEVKADATPEADEYETMSHAELKSLAKERGLKVHFNSSREKLLAALRA